MSYNIRPTTIQTSEAAYFSPPRQRPLTLPIVIAPLFDEEIFSAPPLEGRVTLLNNIDTDAAICANLMLSGLNGVDYFRGANIPEAEVAALLAAEPALSFEMQFPPPASSAQQDDPINYASRPEQQEEPADSEVEESAEEIESDSDEYNPNEERRVRPQKRQAATEDAEPAREDRGSKKASTTQSQPQILTKEEKKREKARISKANYRARIIAGGGPKLEASREKARISKANYRARIIAEGGPKLEASRENARRMEAAYQARKKAERAAAAQAVAE